MNREKYKKVLEAAEKLFNRFGIHKTAVDEIAKLARVAKGTIYNNFGSKEGLIRELLRAQVKKFEEKAQAQLKSLKDPAMRLRAVLMERLHIFLNTPFLSDTMLNKENNDIKQVIKELDDRTKGMISAELDSSLAKTISSVEKKQIADTITFMIRGMEQTLKGSLDNLNIKNIEDHLAYMIKTVLPKHKLIKHRRG